VRVSAAELAEVRRGRDEFHAALRELRAASHRAEAGIRSQRVATSLHGMVADALRAPAVVPVATPQRVQTG